jgi:hydrogenase maturation protein HypF
MGVERKRVRVGGVVQGVGFRPFVWRLAHRHALGGWVENDPSGVTLELQGQAGAIEACLADLRERAPALAALESIDIRELPVDPATPIRFVIRESVATRVAVAAAVPPDVATCDACLAELRDPADRRHGYPFTSCTDCGPRFTIVTDLPYDRSRTTMRSFAMCGACVREYEDPADRRFHAETIACPACGPTVWFTGPDDPGGLAVAMPGDARRGERAIAHARDRLRSGDILAVKGVGGFHLTCDATSAATVGRLRERKHRPDKPLAVMVADVETARRCAIVTGHEQGLLESRERPIVLVRKRADAGVLVDAVAPGNGFVGIMLPSTPLHHMLCAGMPPVVMTSGNLAEEPIATGNGEAAARLSSLVDGFLMHDLDIHVPCDDSVVRCVAGAVLPIRRGRGHVPLPLPLGSTGPTVLAVGGELKAAVCLAAGPRAIMSQHVGDMGTLETLEALGRVAEHLMRLFAIEPEAVACDLHPGYLSAGWARRFAAERGIPVVPVQHHEAHVAAVMAEHGIHDGPLLGVCFDGTGYGRDGTIQGGEFLIVEQGRFRRAAHLDVFPLPGGDASIRHPWRTALAMLHAAGIAWDESLPPVRAASEQERRVLRRQLETGVNCTGTSSVGRLFDGVAAIAGVRHSVTHEAEAAMGLESLAMAAGDDGTGYGMPVVTGEPMRIDWRPLVGRVAADVIAGVSRASIAGRFHRGVAVMIADVCVRLREATGIGRVGLTGGVFQNALLVELTIDVLHRAGFEVLLHERVPPNDGGLALGQAVLARARLQSAATD